MFGKGPKSTKVYVVLLAKAANITVVQPPQTLCLCQVIYKRFNIACPLQVFGNYSVNTTIPEDTCTAKFFTINQEVRN